MCTSLLLRTHSEHKRPCFLNFTFYQVIFKIINNVFFIKGIHQSKGDYSQFLYFLVLFSGSGQAVQVSPKYLPPFQGLNLEPCRISKTELFSEIVNGWKLLSFVTKTILMFERVLNTSLHSKSNPVLIYQIN